MSDSLDAAPLRLQSAAPITIEGRGATLQANWGRPRCIDFARTADYQTFRDIEIRDLIFDANHQISPTAESVVGNVANGGRFSSQRINATRIRLRRCRWINVPYGTITSYACFALQSLQLSAGERQTKLTEIRLEQCWMRGGNQGARVTGFHPGSHVAVEVYHDQIYLDIDHDTGVVPTFRVNVSSSNVHIGGLGFGGYCEVHLTGAHSGDVGVEIDGMQRAVVDGRVTDARNAAFFARNFHAPPDPSTQQIRFRKCEARLLRLEPNGKTGSASGFTVGGSTLPNPTFNWAILEDCSFYSAARDFAVTGLALDVPVGAMINRVSIVGDFDIVCNKIDEQATSPIQPALISLFPAQSRFVFEVQGRVLVNIVGAANANVMPRLVWISPENGCQLHLAINEVRLSSHLIGISSGNTQGMVLGGTQLGGGAVSGYIRDLGWGSFSGGDRRPSLLYLSPSSLVSVRKLIIDELDLRHSPSAAPPLVSGNASDINQTEVEIRHVRSPPDSVTGGR